MTKPRTKGAAAKAAEPVRSNRARAVADLLPDAGRATFRKFGFVQHSVVSRWPEIVGERLARVSGPESIRFPHGKRAEGVLTLIVGGAHATMMQHVAPEIIERVNRFFGYAAVSRVVISQGEVRRAARPETPVPVAAPLSAEMSDSLRAIIDPELKAVLEALAVGVATPVPKIGKIS